MMDSSILIELIKDNAAPMTKTLHDTAYIHSGYVSILLAAREEVRTNADTD